MHNTGVVINLRLIQAGQERHPKAIHVPSWGVAGVIVAREAEAVEGAIRNRMGNVGVEVPHQRSHSREEEPVVVIPVQHPPKKAMVGHLF